MLLIEQDAATARLMAWILAEAGYEIEIESDPQSGARHAAQAPPDVVILNTEMDPAETAGWIRRMRAHAPGARFVDMVKASSARGHPAPGAVSALVAPFDADALISVVREAERDGSGIPGRESMRAPKPLR